MTFSEFSHFLLVEAPKTVVEGSPDFFFRIFKYSTPRRGEEGGWLIKSLSRIKRYIVIWHSYFVFSCLMVLQTKNKHYYIFN